MTVNTKFKTNLNENSDNLNKNPKTSIKALLMLELQRMKKRMALKIIMKTQKETETKYQGIMPESSQMGFFCQIDGEKHPSIDSKYTCVECARYVCNNCFISMTQVGIVTCPYCRGKLQKD